MKKQKIIIIIILTLSLISGLLYIGYEYYIKDIIEQKKLIEAEKEVLGEEIYNNEKEKNEKFKLLKEEYASKGLVLTGDNFLENNAHILAIKNYIEASKKDENNQNITKKIAETYFLMKNWKQAHKYYSKISDTDLIDSKKTFYSLFYSSDLENIKSFSGIIDNINSLTTMPEEIFYYTNTLTCLKDFSLCKKNFQDYFLDEQNIIETEELQNINYAIKNYENLKLDELYYKNSLIVGAFLKNKLYPASIILGKEILKEKPNYKPILKIIAQGYFDLGDYENSKKYLDKYYKLDPEDTGVLYMLGLINQKTHDYLLSNIYFTKALKLNYKDKQSIYRLQIYNSYYLEDSKGILKNFDNLISTQEEPNYEDLVLATYYNIINGNKDKGIELIKLGLDLYPNKDDFYGFSGWLLLENGDMENAEMVLKKGFDINPSNSLINLNLGRIEKLKGEKVKSMIYFKRSQKLDNGGEISKMAKVELDKLINTQSGETD